MRLYVSGPMSDKPFYNFPAFEAYTAALRDLGHTVWSPAEMDEEEGIEADPDGAVEDLEEYGGFLLRDLKLIARERIEGVVVLPGWQDSKGAVTEVAFARALRLPTYALVGGGKTLLTLYPPEVLMGLGGEEPVVMQSALGYDGEYPATMKATRRN